MTDNNEYTPGVPRVRERFGEKGGRKLRRVPGPRKSKLPPRTSGAEVDKQRDELTKISALFDDGSGGARSRAHRLSKQTLTQEVASRRVRDTGRCTDGLDIKPYQSAMASIKCDDVWGMFVRPAEKRKVRAVKSLVTDRKGVLASS